MSEPESKRLHWEIELLRSGHWWSWRIFGYAEPRDINLKAFGMFVIPRRSKGSAERAAFRTIDRIERRGRDKISVQTWVSAKRLNNELSRRFNRFQQWHGEGT